MSTPIQSIFRRFFENQKEIFEFQNTIIINPEDVYNTIEDTFSKITYACLREDQKNEKCHNISILEFFNQTIPEKTNIFLIIPKAKKLTEIILHWLSQQDLTQVHVWVVGENDLGAKSFDKFAKRFEFQCQQLDNARRCRVFEMYPKAQFNKTFVLNSYSKTFEFQSKKLLSLPGVFSHGHVDKGTLVLLNYLSENPQPIKGNVLDFACGCGIIAQYCTSFSDNVSGLDTDYFAIHCANESNKLNDSQINFISNDGLKAQPDTKYDWIISNPPFHENKRTNYTITENFINQSKSQLSARGVLLLVVNDFLDYESTIKQSFENIEILYNFKGFKIIKAYN